MKKLIIIICTLLHFTNSNAQYVWYFGSNAGIQFPASSGGLPTAYTSPLPVGNPINTGEGCAVAYDAAGNVIISTDGSTIYDKTNMAMPNGTGLLGNASSTQSGIIVPVPGCNCNKYFVFATAADDGADGLTYSVVDITLNAGKGDIMSTRKNIPLMNRTSFSSTNRFYNSSSEKLTATKDGNGGYWVLAHNSNYTQGKFYAFHITVNSIGNCDTPKIDTSSTYVKITTIGANYGSTSGGWGQMKFSPTGAKVACALYRSFKIQLFDFDISTGNLSNAIDLSLGNNPYGIEFSPNEKFLYVCQVHDYISGVKNIVQYDLSATSIASSFVNIASNSPGIVNNNPNNYTYGSMQLWRDGRIYVANMGERAIGVINNPDLAGIASNYAHATISLPTGIDSKLSLPTFIQDFSNCADPCNKCHNVGFYFNGSSYVTRKDTTIKIGCNNEIDFNPNNGCSTQENVPVLEVTVKDAANNTPSWANSFISNNGNGSFIPPSSLGTYTITYYFGTTNPANNNKDTCDKIVITINDTCTSNTPCTCGNWVSSNYSIAGKADKLNCNNPATLALTANQGDIFNLTPNYVCTGVTGTPCNVTYKIDIFYANGGASLGLTSINDLKLDSCGLMRIVMTPYCAGLACPPCELTINVNCCNCSQDPKPTLYWANSRGASDSLKLTCGETLTNKLDCYTDYIIKVNAPCGSNCIPDSVKTVIQYPNGSTAISYSISGVPLSVGSLTGNIVVTVKAMCNGKWCDECKIVFKQSKACQPLCDNCKDNLKAVLNQGSSSVIVKTHPAATNVNASIMLGGGTDVYTQIRVNVVDVKISSDNPSCLQCYTKANNWGSIIGGSISLPGFVATPSTFAGVAITNPNNSSHEMVFNASTPTAVPNASTINLSINVPGVNQISCCCIKVKLYLKITYRNSKCEECSKTIAIGFTQCPKTRDASTIGNSGSSGTIIWDQTSGNTQFMIASPNPEFSKPVIVEDNKKN